MNKFKVADCVSTLPQNNLDVLRFSIEDLTQDNDKVIIVPHDYIDHDSIGSAAGISLISKKLNKPAYILVNDSPSAIALGLNRMLNEIRRNIPVINFEEYMDIKAKDLVIFTDVSNARLVGTIDEFKDDDTIVIDHHKPSSQPIRSNYSYINHNASSASEIVTKLLMAYYCDIIPRDVANYLLAGIYLDTAHFNKQCDGSIEAALALYRSGATDEVIKEWFIRDAESARKVSEIITSPDIIRIGNYKFAVGAGKQELLYDRGMLGEAADEILRKNEVSASFALGRLGESRVGISARTFGDVDVYSIMRELNGGGDREKAAAILDDGNLNRARDTLIKVLRPRYSKKEEITQ